MLANILFIRSYRYFPASAGATIYRLNLVVVALLSFVWLGEAVTAAKLAGIALGAVAVIALCNGSKGSQGKAATRIGAVMLVAACILRAIMGILYKISSNSGIPPLELLAINGACWLVGGTLAAVVAREPLVAEPVFVRTSLTSGVLVCGIVYFMLAATRLSEASVVIPIAQMGFLLTSVLGIIYHNEIWTARKGAAMLAAVGCIVSLSLH